MREKHRRAHVGPVLAVCFVAGCAVRVGSGGPPPSGDQAAGEVFGPSACARLGAEVKLSIGAGSQSFAFLWDSGRYVVVYPDASSGNLFVATLAADGSVMGSPAPVEQSLPQSDLPSLVKVEGGYLVAWQEGAAGYAVYAHKLGPDGMPSGDGVAVAATTLQQSRPVLAPAPGGQVGLAWMDQFADGSQGVDFALIDPGTLVVDGPMRVAPGDVEGYPWVASNAQALGIVWTDQETGSNGQATYDLPFATIDTQSLEMSTPVSLRGRATVGISQPRVLGTDFGFIAAWEDLHGGDNQIFMTLVDHQGGRIGGGLVEEPNSGDANWPNIAWSGTSAGIVYYQWRQSRPQIFISFVDSKGSRVGGLHDLQVSNGMTGWSRYPQVAWTGSEFAVMYVDTRDGPPALWMQRVQCKG